MILGGEVVVSCNVELGSESGGLVQYIALIGLQNAFSRIIAQTDRSFEYDNHRA